MKQIKLGETLYTVEIEWEALKGISSIKKELRTIAADRASSKNSFKKALIVKGEGCVAAGLISDSSKMLGKSAAFLLAAANNQENKKRVALDEESTNWLFVDEVNGEQDKYWICLIQDGVPLPGLDIVVSWDGVEEHLSDLLLNAAMYNVISPVKEVSDFVKEIAQVQVSSFDDLVSGVKEKAKIVQIRGISLPLVLMVFSVFAAGGGYYWYDSWVTEQKMLAAAALQNQMTLQQAKLQQQSQADENMKDSAQKELLRGELEKEVVEELHFSNVDILREWNRLIGSVPLNHQGWSLVGVECNVIGEIPECNIALNRTKSGTYKSLLKMVPSVTFTEKDKAFYTKKGNVLPKRTTALTNLMDKKAMDIDYGSQFQILEQIGLSFDRVPEELLKKEIIPPAPVVEGFKPPEQNADIKVVDIGVSKGTYSLVGDGLWKLNSIANTLSDSSMNVKKLLVGVKGIESSPWTLSGNYFVRSAAGNDNAK